MVWFSSIWPKCGFLTCLKFQRETVMRLHQYGLLTNGPSLILMGISKIVLNEQLVRRTFFPDK